MPNVTGESSDASVAAITGVNTAGGEAVTGRSGAGNGVHGISDSAYGVYGESKSGRGVVAISQSSYGLRAGSGTSSAIRASSDAGVGIEARGGPGFVGIFGASPDADGVKGQSEGGGAGVSGVGRTGGAFEGSFEGVHAVSHDPSAAGVAGYNDNTGPGIYGKSVHGAAAVFDGDVFVTGDVQLKGADVAEHFDTAGSVIADPGTVMVLDGPNRVRVSQSAYDRKVVGVVAGAGDYRPGLVLDHHANATAGRPLALVGKTFCKIDASFGAVEVGDLLTTSPTAGHAMKATEPSRAFGAVLGKAMAPLSEGRGLLPILVSLQ